MKRSVIEQHPDILSGVPVFHGTRVPVEVLFDYLEGGHSIGDFLEGFPSVSEKQVIAALEEMKERMLVGSQA